MGAGTGVVLTRGIGFVIIVGFSGRVLGLVSTDFTGAAGFFTSGGTLLFAGRRGAGGRADGDFAGKTSREGAGTTGLDGWGKDFSCSASRGTTSRTCFARGFDFARGGAGWVVSECTPARMTRAARGLESCFLDWPESLSETVSASSVTEMEMSS